MRALALTDRLGVLLAAASELTGPHDLDHVLQHVVESAASVADARYSALGIYGTDGRISTFVHFGFDSATVQRIGRLPEGSGLLGQVIVADEPVRLEDLNTDARACGFPAGHPPMRSFLGVPVVRGGRRYGNLYLTEKNRGGIFDADDEALVVTLATFAAGALESAELMMAERERADAIAERDVAEEKARFRRELLAHTIAVQEAERSRLARDLHDDVGQALTSVLLGLRMVETSMNAPTINLDEVRDLSADLRELVASALRRARELAFNLRPTVLDDIGLAPALERLGTDVAQRSGLRIDLVVSLRAHERFEPETETAVYRVVQEALTNIVRHAQASVVAIDVTGFGDRIQARVADDGVGFDQSSLPEPSRLGLVGMEERVHLVGGILAVTSAPGEGTTVLVDVPRG
jgi:signal transduction histidine kinase